MLFKITKAQVEAYVNNGLTIKQMAEDITTKSGTKCTEAVVRKAGKTYGIDFKFKKRSTAFVFEDLDTANPVPVGVTTSSVDSTPVNDIVEVVA
jgi:hypothetical protein